MARVAFVLGGGGHAGAAEVGMLHALLDREVRPDLIVGTSVGALHGAMVAVEPSQAAAEKREDAWQELAQRDALVLYPEGTTSRSVCECG